MFDFRLFTISLTLTRQTRENQAGPTSTSAQAESSHFMKAMDCDLDHREETLERRPLYSCWMSLGPREIGLAAINSSGIP
jgi:hypothetical protein